MRKSRSLKTAIQNNDEMATCVIVQDVGLLRVRSTWKISIASERDRAEGEALARDLEGRASMSAGLPIQAGPEGERDPL
jgi:hypothetical protein